MLPSSNLHFCGHVRGAVWRWATIALVVALSASATAQPAGDDPYAPDFVETSRVTWGDVAVVFEENRNAESVAFFPFLASQHRIIDARGVEIAVVDGVDPSNVVLADLDGNGQLELVMTGNSGGATGCCDLLEVWTLADGAPTQAFLLWGGRGVGDGFGLLDERPDGRIPVYARQDISVGDLPLCCLPSVPRAFTWNGRFFEDATRTERMDALLEERERYRDEIRSRSTGAADDVTLDAAAIGAYAVAAIIGADEATAELETLRASLSVTAFDRLTAIVPQIHRALEAWIFELNN